MSIENNRFPIQPGNEILHPYPLSKERELEAMDYTAENIKEILESVRALNESMVGRESEIEALKVQLQQAENLVNSLRSKRNELLDANRNDRMKKIEAEREAARAQRFLDAQEKRDAILKELKEKEKQLDIDTAGAPWREFAFDHQINGGKRLAIAKRGILADKRGLGKTLSSLIWLDMVKAQRILVLAPNDVVPQFEDEIRQWQPHRTIFSLRGLNPQARGMIYPMLSMVKEFIITLNYEAWRKDKSIVDDLVKAGIDSIVLDESHRIKSSTKQTARGVFQLAYRPNYCKSCDKVGNYEGPWYHNGAPHDENAKTRYYSCPECGDRLDTTVENLLCMTGTPILNKPQELFSMLYLIDCNRFPSEKMFLKDYCYSYAPGKWKFMTGGLDRLTNQMSEFFVQRSREDAGITVPPPAIKTYYIEKDFVNYRRQYQAEKDLRNAAALIMENGESMNMLNLLEIILRERQVMAWPAGVLFRDPETKEVLCNFDVEESQKMDEAFDLLGDLCEEGERVIVWSKFKPPLYEMHRRIVKEGYNAVIATGDQSSHVKSQIRADFDLKSADKENYRWQVCFATYDAFGTGINLNAARHCIMLDDEWSPGMQDQAIGRIDRLNSVDQANVHIFRVKGSIDMFMEQLIEMKRELADGFEHELTPKMLVKMLQELD